MEPQRHDAVTDLLIRWKAGDSGCLNRLIPLVESELRSIARRCLRNERNGHTLQTTALVNEVYLKLVDHDRQDWQNRAQFLGVAARLMRQILVDHARELRRDKRGAGVQPLPLNEELIFSPARSAALVALDDALQYLARFDARKSTIVELRYFGGLTVEETAAVLAVHPNTVVRDWRFAKVWLKRELSAKGACAG